MIFRAHYIDRSIAKGQNIERENISLVALLTGARFANPRQLLKDQKDAHVGDSYTNFCSCPNFLIFSCYIQYLELHKVQITKAAPKCTPSLDEHPAKKQTFQNASNTSTIFNFHPKPQHISQLFPSRHREAI